MSTPIVSYRGSDIPNNHILFVMTRRLIQQWHGNIVQVWLFQYWIILEFEFSALLSLVHVIYEVVIPMLSSSRRSTKRIQKEIIIVMNFKMFFKVFPTNWLHNIMAGNFGTSTHCYYNSILITSCMNVSTIGPRPPPHYQKTMLTSCTFWLHTGRKLCFPEHILITYRKETFLIWTYSDYIMEGNFAHLNTFWLHNGRKLRSPEHILIT